MSIRQEQLARQLDCEQLRCALQNINSRLNQLQQSIPNPAVHQLKVKYQKRAHEPVVPKLDLKRIQKQNENYQPLKKVTATFGEGSKLEQQHQTQAQQPQPQPQPQPLANPSQHQPLVERTPTRVRSCSVNLQNQPLQNKHLYQFKVTQACSQNNSCYQSLNQSQERIPLNQSAYLHATRLADQRSVSPIQATPIKQIPNYQIQQTPARNATPQKVVTTVPCNSRQIVKYNSSLTRILTNQTPQVRHVRSNIRNTSVNGYPIQVLIQQ